MIPVLSQSQRRRRPVAGDATLTEALTSFAANAGTRNDFRGFVGFKFTMNATKTVRSLGRRRLSGNSTSHHVILFNSNYLPIAVAHIDASSGVVNADIFNDLIADVTLESGQSYWLFSGENETDLWYEYAAATLASDLTLDGSAFVLNLFPEITSYLYNQAIPLRNGYPGSDGFTGRAGYKFTPAANQTITELRRFKSDPADDDNHTLYLMDSSGATLASVVISNAGQPTGFVGGSVSYSVTGGVDYYIMSSEISNGDTWFDQSPAVLTAGLTLVGAGYYDGTVHDTSAAKMYHLIDFTFGSSQRAIVGYSSSLFNVDVGDGKVYVPPNFQFY